MSKAPVKNISGYLFIASGIIFLVVAVSGGRTTHYGLGAAFIAVGVVFLARSRRPE